MDRASTIRFYDHYGHVSAAVCYQNTLHARTGDGRLDHARTHEPREGKGVKIAKGRASYHQGQRYSRDGPTHARAATVDRIDVRTPTYHPDPPTRTRDHPR